MALNNNSRNLIFTSIELSKILEDENIKSFGSTGKLLSSLKEKCLTSTPSVAASALHVLTSLVGRNVLSLAEGLSTLISLMSSSKDPTPALIPAVGRLIILEASQPEWGCSYNLSDRPHPFVTILRFNWIVWDGVAAFILSVLSEQSKLEVTKRLTVVRPVVSTVLFDPSSPSAAKKQVVQLLTSFRHENFLLRTLVWQQIDINWCWLVKEVIENLQDRKPGNISCVEALTPALAAAVAWLTVNGHDPTIWITMLERQVTSSSTDVVLFILARVILTCPTIYLQSIAQLCKGIVLKKDCCVWSASAVAAAMLNWALCPSILTAGLTDHCQEILKTLPCLKFSGNSKKLFQNPQFIEYVNSNPDVRLASDFILLTDEWQDNAGLLMWLTSVFNRKASSAAFIRRLQPLLLAVTLQTRSPQVTNQTLKLSVECSRSDPSFSFPFLCVVLHKLSKETEPQLQLEYLKIVPQMSIDKDNVPLVLGTIQSLEGGDPGVMMSLRMALLLSLWLIQPRTFPYLHRLVQGTRLENKKNWEIQVARAATLLAVCSERPHTHGKEVIGLLSDVLNASDGQSGAEASALVINAIAQLCKAGVVDIQGTWSALEPKIRREDRPRVAASVCRLLTEAADCRSEVACADAITQLWVFVESDCAAADALIALSHFPPHVFALKSLPSRFRQNLVIPKDLIKKDVVQAPEEVLSYVPGHCWIQVLEKIEDKLLEAAEKMVQGLVTKEVAGLPRGIYSLPLGASEPKTLSHLPQSSVLRALTDFLQIIHVEGWTSSRLSLSVVRLLSKDYLRPLPPLDWTFLLPGLMEKNSVGHIVRLCAEQGPKSATARAVLQGQIEKMDADDVETATLLLEVLPGVSQCVTTTVLSPLVSDLLRTTLVDRTLFEDAIAAVRRTIALATVSEANRTAIAKAVKGLLIDIPLDFEDVEAFWECLSELPNALVETITIPKHWTEVTSRRMRHALRVCRADALSQKTSDCPLDSFTVLIDDVCLRNQDQTAVLQEVLIILKKTTPDRFSGWFSMLMARLLAATSANSLEGTLFLLKLLMVSAIALSGCDLFLKDPESLIEDRKAQLRLFPGSVHMLFDSCDAKWIRVLPNVVEFLHRLSKWEPLPNEEREMVHQTLLSLRSHAYCLAPARWPRLFYRPK